MNQNERIPITDRIEPRVNRYYLKVSRQYMVLGVVLFAMLILYIVCIMAFFGEYVTYDNLKYLIRDWNAMTMPGSGEYTDIVYTSSDKSKFTSFRGGLALYDSEKYCYYDESGICLVEDEHGYADPEAAVSDKYLLLYDIGGTGYTMYNQLTRIIRREADRSIIAADVADTGAMVIVTRSRETKFVAEVYNAAFVKTMNIHKENYVLGAAISPDGENIVLCSAVPSATDFNLEIEICRIGSSERTALLNYEHTMPLDVVAHENGFILLCDNGLYFADYDGHITSAVDFDGMTLAYADIGSSGAALIGQVNALGTENRVIVCGIDGAVLYDRTVDERLSGIWASVNSSDSLAYIRAGKNLLKLMPDETLAVHEPETGEILSVIPREKSALVCRESGAYIWNGN